MSRSRMFGGDDDAIANSSPRTTIVGGRPPEDDVDLPPIPTGIQKLLRLASVDEKFLSRLVNRPDEVARAAGIELTKSEQAMLSVVSEEQLKAMARSLQPPEPARRKFLRIAAEAAVLALGGAALGGVFAYARKKYREERSPAADRIDTPEAAHSFGIAVEYTPMSRGLSADPPVEVDGPGPDAGTEDKRSRRRKRKKNSRKKGPRGRSRRVPQKRIGKIRSFGHSGDDLITRLLETWEEEDDVAAGVKRRRRGRRKRKR